VTVLQRNRFVADARIFRPGSIAPAATAKSFSPNETRPKNRKIVNIFAENKAVVKMAVAVVLIVIPLVGLGSIVLPSRSGTGGKDGHTLRQIKIYSALEVNRVAEISARQEVQSAASRSGDGFDGAIDGRSVDRIPVTLGAEFANIVIGSRGSSPRLILGSCLS